MPEVQAIVNTAKNYLSEAYRDSGIHDLLLEEIESGDVDSREVWRFTLSFRRDQPPKNNSESFSEVALGKLTLSEALNPQKPGRDYKVIEVDGATNVVLAMKIRNFAAA